MITEETIARVKSSLQATKSFTALEVIEELEKENTELKIQNEKMENCWNCKFFKEKKYQACIDYKKNNTKCCAFYKWGLADE